MKTLKMLKTLLGLGVKRNIEQIKGYWWLLLITLILSLSLAAHNQKGQINVLKNEIQQLKQEQSQLQSDYEKLYNMKMFPEKNVVVTAYNSYRNQCDDDPFIAAWGDKLNRLEKGTRAIAVSRDLEEMGLTYGKKVEIEGLGTFKVLDRTSHRLSNRIDIYMGLDKRRAKGFGKKELKIKWSVLG